MGYRAVEQTEAQTRLLSPEALRKPIHTKQVPPAPGADAY